MKKAPSSAQKLHFLGRIPSCHMQWAGHLSVWLVVIWFHAGCVGLLLISHAGRILRAAPVKLLWAELPTPGLQQWQRLQVSGTGARH